MKLYVTTKNSGPSWSYDPLTIVYLGLSVDDAIQAVPEDFRQYRRDDYLDGSLHKELFSAIPRSTSRSLVAFYIADGWWYSVVEVDFPQ